jgi:hypothetical protein
MNIIRLFVRWFWNRLGEPSSPDSDHAVPEPDSETPDRTVHSTGENAWADDDSPPGHKIRWHA